MGSGSSEVQKLPCRGEALDSVSNLEKQTEKKKNIESRNIKYEIIIIL